MSGRKVLLDVPYLDQSVRYPTGCESVSAVMLLRYLGYSLSVDAFIETYLTQTPFTERDGVRWGGDPRKVFCGSPYDPEGFGCYAPVIREALARVFQEEKRDAACGADVQRTGAYTAVDETGAAMERLLAYLDRGMPVIFWACINMREPVVGPSWKLLGSGETFTWISNEHCMLLIGYDDDGYYFNDPYENHGQIYVPRALAEARHAAQYRMAVGVRTTAADGRLL